MDIMEQPIVYVSNPNPSQCKSTLCADPLRNTNGSKFSELFTGDSLLELCNSFWMCSPGAKKDVQPYLRGCKWSPDGTCCLSVVNHDGFHVMELPRDMYEGCPFSDRMITLLPAVIHVKESGIVYDFCWYPKMNSHYPETCSWISTKFNSPIQMWDAYNGSLRCSYRGFNAVDEMEPAISVTFINQGQRIVGGYKNCLRTFDVERPGRDFLEHKIKSPASCFATNGNLLAVGSWNANIQLFSIFDNGTYKSVGNLHAHKGGITHLQFTPDGTKLVSGARKDHNLCVWDVRYHRRPLNILKRSVSTNQRIYFDISACGRYLVSGGTDGIIRVWDNKFTKWTEQFNVNQANQENATFRFQLHRDCCNSISIHPSRPILATGSGQFHFLDPVKVLEFERESGTNRHGGDDSSVEFQSMTNESSSDEQTLVEGADVSLTEVHKPDFANDVGLQLENVKESHCSDMEKMDSTKEFTGKVLHHEVAEVLPPKIFALESTEPSAKKHRFSNDFSSPVLKEIVDSKATVCASTFEAFNVAPSNVKHDKNEPPVEKRLLNVTNQSSKEFPDTDEIPIKENNLVSVSEIDIIDKASSEAIKVNSLPSIKKGNSTTEQSLDSKSFTENEINVQSLTNNDNVEKTDTLFLKKSALTNIEEVHSNFELPTLSELPSGELKFDAGWQSPTKATQQSNSDRSSTKVFNVPHIEKPPDGKFVEQKALESDDGYSDINENKMKYSSYTENNLTFWWIGKIFERQAT